jgi:hypothetical protein
MLTQLSLHSCCFMIWVALLCCLCCPAGMFRPAMLGTRPSVDGSLVDGGGSMMMMMVPGGAMGGGGVPVMVSGEELVELRSKVEELGLRVPDLTLLQKVGVGTSSTRVLSKMSHAPHLLAAVLRVARFALWGAPRTYSPDACWPPLCLCLPYHSTDH